MWFIGMLLYGGVAQAVNDIMNNGCHSSIKHLAWFSPDAVLVHRGLIQRCTVPDLKSSCAGDTSQNAILFKQNPISVVCASYNTIQGDEIDWISQRMTPCRKRYTDLFTFKSKGNPIIQGLFDKGLMVSFQTTKVGSLRCAFELKLVRINLPQQCLMVLL